MRHVPGPRFFPSVVALTGARVARSFRSTTVRCRGFGIMIICCVTDHHEGGSCFAAPAFNMASVRSSICTVSLGYCCAFLVFEPAARPVTVHCQCSDLPIRRGTTTSLLPALSGPSCLLCLRSGLMMCTVVHHRSSSRADMLLGLCERSNLVKSSPEPH